MLFAPLATYYRCHRLVFLQMQTPWKRPGRYTACRMRSFREKTDAGRHQRSGQPLKSASSMSALANLLAYSIPRAVARELFQADLDIHREWIDRETFQSSLLGGVGGRALINVYIIKGGETIRGPMGELSTEAN